MGLCKCPKRKVTNLFCFEHRVNVCEHCLVANHEKCIVKSYLQWLQDSDYDPSCPLCRHPLSDDNCRQCVRLSCYDVFHWECLDANFMQFPSNTAPAGYTCPICDSCIFPSLNLATPVAEALRSTLRQVNWARAGLGLPLVEDAAPLANPAVIDSSPGSTSPGIPLSTSVASTPVSKDCSMPASRPSAHVSPFSSTSSSDVNTFTHSVINIDDGTSSRQFSNPRKLFGSETDDGGLPNQSHDHDVDKYKRRSAFRFLTQWFRIDTRKNDPSTSRKRFFIVFLLCILGFFTILVIFSQLSHYTSDNDPLLDPMDNPNIRVKRDAIA